MSLPDRVWDKADPIDGWLWRSEADLLWRLCDGPWCEVGCWRGKSTVVLAETGHPGYAVDWFKGSPEHPDDTDTFRDFMDNIAGYDHVAVLAMRFDEAAARVKPVRLLHLDADHSLEATERAFELYAPKVKAGGHVVFHDGAGGAWPEVEKVVTAVHRDPDWQYVETVERAVAFRRR